MDEIPTQVNLPNTHRDMFLLRHPDSYVDSDKLRDAIPPPPGYCYTLDGRLVPLLECRLPIEDPIAQGIFCEVLEVTGNFRAACDCLGIKSAKSVKEYLLLDTDFHESVEAAADRHRHNLYAVAVQRATVGYQVPIVGGKNKDQVVAYETKVSDSLLTLLLKRHFVEFRDTGKPTQINIDASTKTVTVNDMRSLTREQRNALRLLVKPVAPDSPDPSGIGGVDEADPPTIIDTDSTEVADVIDVLDVDKEKN